MYMKTRILFVGNSFTARNNLPGLLSQLVESGGKGAMEWKLASAGGASLRQHFNKGDAARMADNVRDLNALVGQASARTILYMTWARADAPETQTAISAAYANSGQQVDATVVPAGLAWQLYLVQEPQIVLHDKDGSHLTLDIAVSEEEQIALQACARQAVSVFRKGAF